MSKHTPIQRAGIGLPAARLLAVHDLLTLALDATEGPLPQNWQLPEARGYLRHALRQLDRLLPIQTGRAQG